MSRIVLSTEHIDVPGGWSGCAVTGLHDLVAEAATARDLPSAEEWRAWLGRLVGSARDLPGFAQLKYSPHGEVWRARFDFRGKSIEVVGKQSRPYGLRRLAAPLRPSRERRNFNRALALLEAGINTPLPLALIERGTLWRESWLVTEFTSGLVDLDQVALQFLPRLDCRRSRRVKDAIVQALVELFTGMASSGLTHRDMKASNILLKDWDGQAAPPSVWIVDLDGLQSCRLAMKRSSWRPVVRLGASLLGYSSVTGSDFVRFLRAYLALRGDPGAAWRAAFRTLAPSAAEYLRKSRRRKREKLDGYEG